MARQRVWLDEVYGLTELAEIFGVDYWTPRTWRTRGQLPPEDTVISRKPAWTRATLERWAKEQGLDVVTWEPARILVKRPDRRRT